MSSQLCVLPAPRLARDDEDAVLVSRQVLQSAPQLAAVDHGTTGPGPDEPDGERVITAVPGPVAAGQRQQGTHSPLELSAERRIRLGHARDERAELTLPRGVRHRLGPGQLGAAQAVVPRAQARGLQDRADPRLAVHAVFEHADDELGPGVAGIGQGQVIEIQLLRRLQPVLLEASQDSPHLGAPGSW